jgi:Zn-dependent peptidase ImmA (M78 family)
MTKRDEILEAVSEAASIVEDFPVENRTSFDLLRVLNDYDIPVVYRPLNSLLGAAISVGNERGILVTTNRNRQIQRFTLAHELCHILLNHELKFDESIGYNHRVARSASRPPEESAADMFASKLLAPLNLIVGNIRRQGWNSEDITEPEKIYQLSLRLGLSFQAMCWALDDNDLLDRSVANNYCNDTGIVKRAKNWVVDESVPRESYADVWLLSQRDAGTQLEASPDDIFVIQLEDMSSAGYRWEVNGSDSSVEVLRENIAIGEDYGSTSVRKTVFRFDSVGRHSLRLHHERPWTDEVYEEIQVVVDNGGYEDPGLPRRLRNGSITEAVP